MGLLEQRQQRPIKLQPKQVLELVGLEVSLALESLELASLELASLEVVSFHRLGCSQELVLVPSLGKSLESGSLASTREASFLEQGFVILVSEFCQGCQLELESSRKSQEQEEAPLQGSRASEALVDSSRGSLWATPSRRPSSQVAITGAPTEPVGSSPTALGQAECLVVLEGRLATPQAQV